MKKSFAYNLTQFGGADNTVTEQIKTSDGVKTITTDANTGAVILSDQVDEDSLNPVTGAAVATAIAQGGGGVPEYGESDAGKVLQVDAQGEELVWAVAGGAYTAGNGISIEGDEIAVAIGSGGIQIDSDNNSLMIADEYGLVHVDDGSILINHDDTISEGTDLDGHGMLGVANPVPTVAYADTGKFLGVVDGPAATLGWLSAGGLPSYSSSDWGKVLSVKQASQGSSSSTVYWATSVPGGQLLGNASTSSAGHTLNVNCDIDKSYLYNLVCIVPTLNVDDSLVDKSTEYYLDLNLTGGMSTGTERLVIKFYDGVWGGVGSDASAVAYTRRSSLSSVSIASLTKTDGTLVMGDWLLSGSSIYVYGLA